MMQIASMELPGDLTGIHRSAIYFVQSETDGPIKVGVSTNIQSRLSQMQTGSPYDIRLIGVAYEEREFTEKNVHRVFQNFRIRGEWFKPNPDLLRLIAACRTTWIEHVWDPSPRQIFAQIRREHEKQIVGEYHSDSEMMRKQLKYIAECTTDMASAINNVAEAGQAIKNLCENIEDITASYSSIVHMLQTLGVFGVLDVTDLQREVKYWEFVGGKVHTFEQTVKSLSARTKSNSSELQTDYSAVESGDDPSSDGLERIQLGVG